MTDICNIHCKIQTTAMYQEQQNDSFTSDKSGLIQNSQVLETKVGIDNKKLVLVVQFSPLATGHLGLSFPA